MWQRITSWLNTHPYAKGAVTAVEGALVGVLIDWSSNPQPFTKAGLHQTLVTVGGAVVIALRNYFKQAPRKEWTEEQRQAATTPPTLPAPPDPPSASSASAGGQP